jgi:hypothetical protein
MFGFKSSFNLIYFHFLALLYFFSAAAEAFLCLAKTKGFLSSMVALVEVVVFLLLVVSVVNTLAVKYCNISPPQCQGFLLIVFVEREDV